jgi:hypothetical protein
MRTSKGFLLRILPFFATFAIGIFIASFFVNITAPNFRGRGRKGHEMRRVRAELEEVRGQYLRLQNEHSHCKVTRDPATGEEVMSLMPIDAPPPPPAPAAPRVKQ